MVGGQLNPWYPLTRRMGLAPESVWVLWRTDKSHALAWNWTSSLVCSLATILTKLSWHHWMWRYFILWTSRSLNCPSNIILMSLMKYCSGISECIMKWHTGQSKSSNFQRFIEIKTGFHYWWDIHSLIQDLWRFPLSPMSHMAYVSVIFHCLSYLCKFYFSVVLYFHSPICLYDMYRDNFNFFHLWTETFTAAKDRTSEILNARHFRSHIML
jgi:hypothetical protein